MTTSTAATGKGISISPKNVIGFILLLLLAAVFIFSGISKLYSFGAFSWQIMDAGISNLQTAAILARTIIGVELLLGVFMVAHIFLRSFTLPVVIVILLLFTGYLISLLVRHGNTGDCGCFGEAYAMSPLQGIGKNVIATGIAILLYYIYPVRPYKNSEWIAAFTGMAAMALPFIFFPLSESNKPTVINKPLDLEPLYHSENPKNLPPDIDLRQGKQIVAFLSLRCKHCKKAAFSLQIIQRQHTELPIYLVLNGKPEMLREFMDETQAGNVPYSLFQGPEEFIRMAGPSVPSIYWVNNGVAERESNIFQLDPAQMQQWLME